MLFYLKPKVLWKMPRNRWDWLGSGRNRTTDELKRLMALTQDLQETQEVGDCFPV
jgi:hypothetical protein